MTSLSQPRDGDYNVTLGRLRLVLVFVLLALLVVWGRPSPWGLFVGFGIAALGETIRMWASGHLRKTVELVTSGPYRFTRHPLYLGRLLIFTGLCLAIQLPGRIQWLVLAGGYAVFFGYYLRRKERVESARLLARHGQRFQAYRDHVPALLPRLTPYPEATPQRWSANRMARNRESWMVLGLLGVFGFWAWRLMSFGS